MSLSFDVETSRRCSSEDTFQNLTLYKTTHNTFTKSWGTPTSYEVLPKEEWYSSDMESYEAVYDWGTARFCVKKEGSAPVLYALDTTSTKMTAPRTTKVGMSGEDVMAKFRDLGQAALNDTGDRLLYNWNLPISSSEPTAVRRRHICHPVIMTPWMRKQAFLSSFPTIWMRMAMLRDCLAAISSKT